MELAWAAESSRARSARSTILSIPITRFILIATLAASRCFAGEDTNVAAVGDWSTPVANSDGYKIRGRLLICDTPAHSSSIEKTDTAVYLELQEFSDFLSTVEVYCELDTWSKPVDYTGGLRCELRDDKGRPAVTDAPAGFSGGGPGTSWITLDPYCSARLRVSAYGGGRLDDGGVGIHLASRGWWNVHPNPTNEYFLSGTFTAIPPTNRTVAVGNTKRNVWEGTLKLPGVKIPVKKK